MQDRPLKILIADDTPTNIKQMEVVVRRLGHEPVVATDGLQAIAVYEREAPDMVFMDINMPRLDGISAVRRIREIDAGSKWTPIVFVSALDGIEDIVKGIEAGGDDYIVKPASLSMLRARINGYSRLLRLQRELEIRREQSEEQAQLGAHVMDRLTDAEGLRDPIQQHFNIPAETFSGDLLCAARAPGDVFSVMLADATGHGLPAALTALPLTQAFYSMTAKGFPLSSIAEELNRKLKAILPPDRFVAATLASVDVRNQTVEVWNGGNPAALFVTQEGMVAMRWISRHPPLGILTDGQFSGATDTAVFNEPGELLLCSDGLIEAENHDGTWLNEEGVMRLLGQGTERRLRFDNLRRGVDGHLGGRPARDDISCMMVALPVERRRKHRVASPGIVEHKGEVQAWRMELSYGAGELRYIDVVPAVLGFLTQVNILRNHQGTLFLIVSELFSNALDYGLLGLDSSTKDWIGGFDIYMQQRAERLSALRSGRIDLAFEIHRQGRHAVLDICVSDTGPGFAYRGVLADSERDEGLQRPQWRGIPLVKSLCSELVYSGSGNKVRARYILSEIAAADGTEPLKEVVAAPWGNQGSGDGMILFEDPC